MKKTIRLLIENLFDDLYDIDQENDLTVDIANKIYKENKVGDIYYKNKKPYAICCGLDTDFKDNESRFMLLNYNFQEYYFCKFNIQNKLNSSLEQIIKPPYIDMDNIPFISNLKNIASGYDNTQVIIKNYNKSAFPAINYCYKLDKKCYIPSIYELLILEKYIIKLNQIINKYNGTLIQKVCYLSSTYCTDGINNGILYINFNDRANQYYQLLNIKLPKINFWSLKANNYVIPFIKL